jgi:hypothetical protein
VGSRAGASRTENQAALTFSVRVNGLGTRAGNTALEELVAAIEFLEGRDLAAWLQRDGACICSDAGAAVDVGTHWEYMGTGFVCEGPE